MQTVYVDKGSTLSSIVKEWNARWSAYLVADRYDGYLLVTQALHRAAKFISSIENADSVTATALYNAARSGHEVKFRWRVVEHDLDSVVIAFARERDRFDATLIIGNPVCYKLHR